MDLFGVSCDLEDDIAVIGAHGNDGEAFIFRRVNEEWRYLLSLFPSNPNNAGWFGYVTALKGGQILIGAPAFSNGFVFLYQYDEALQDWTYQTTFLPSDPVGPSNEFGGDMWFDTESDAFFVADINDYENGPEAGAVYLFREDAEGWAEPIKLFPSFPTPGDCFGRSIALVGDTMVVGAPCGGQGYVVTFAGAIPIDCNQNGEPDGCDIFSGFSADENGDGVPDECSSSGDLDHDGDVDFTDLLSLLGTWGPCGEEKCPADLDDSQAVGFADLILLLSQWT